MNAPEPSGFALAEDLAFGVVDPRALDPDWTAPIRDVDFAHGLRRGA